MFSAGHIVGGAPVKVTARHLLLIQFDKLACSDAFLGESRSFFGRSITINNLVRCRKLSNFFNPILNCRVNWRHLVSSVSAPQGKTPATAYKSGAYVSRIDCDILPSHDDYRTH